LVAEGERAVQALLQASGVGPEADAAAGALYRQVLAPFAAELAGVERLYVAPDGALYLAGMPALRGPDGRRLLEAMDVRLVQTGRDLLRPPTDRPARGLVALGGIAFDRAPAELAPAAPAPPVPTDAAAPAPVPGAPPGAERERLRRRTAATLRSGLFPPLPGTKQEVEQIAEQYGRARSDEPAPAVLEGTEASKARLLALAAPPRVLHLATHGFYLGRERPIDRPLLLAGIALAGANQALEPDPDAQDGILYAIEAQDLNLEGTELVVLSACDTAQGQIDYADGISGLVRALRTAGASHVLVSLRPVSDEGAAAFMRRFYAHWLGQGRSSDPAAALRATQREYLAPEPDTNDKTVSAASTLGAAAPGAAGPDGPDDTWTSFILVGD
jgi:CHAT domain-containing protein